MCNPHLLSEFQARWVPPGMHQGSEKKEGSEMGGYRGGSARTPG